MMKLVKQKGDQVLDVRIFKETLNVRCSDEIFSEVATRLLHSINQCSLVREIIDHTRGVDHVNEYDLKLPQDCSDEDLEVHTIEVVFSIGREVHDLDELSDQILESVLFALDKSQAFDYFSLLEPVSVDSE